MMSTEGVAMVTKTKHQVTEAPAVPRKRAAPAVKPAFGDRQPNGPPPDAAPPPGKPNLLRAGLKALGTVRDDVVHRQSRVFESILGIDPAQAWSGLGRVDAAARKAAQEAFGLNKFEAVFDQRVLHALERMGMPSVKELHALRDEVASLKAELRSLKAAAKRSR